MKDFLIKFFEKKKYVDEFRSGKIRLMSAAHYASLESNMNLHSGLYNNRMDATEGISFHMNRTNSDSPLTMTFKNGVKCNVGAGVESVLLNSFSMNSQYKISCFYALDESDMPTGTFRPALESMQDSLGDFYILFSNPALFAHLINDEVMRLVSSNIVKSFLMKRVTYYDESTFTGTSTPFHKPLGLSWQKEYRLLIETVNSDDPFYIDIGSIENITTCGKVADLLNAQIINDSTIFIPNQF